MGEIVNLNISGVQDGFSVSKKLLTSMQGSKLEQMFSGKYKL